MKEFTGDDVSNGRIFADRSELIFAPLEWQKRGLQETASGYGSRLNTGMKIRFDGRDYRLYATCFSNVSSVWFTVRGRKIYVD